MEQRRVKQRFWNEKLGWYDEREIVTGKYKFTEEDKMSIVSEYVTGGRPAQEIAGKYHLSSRQIIFNWMDKYVMKGKSYLCRKQRNIWQIKHRKSA